MSQDTQREVSEALPSQPQLQQLHRATNELYTAESVAECTQHAVETAIDGLGFDWCVAISVDEETGQFDPVATAGTTEFDIEDRPMELGESIIAAVYRRGEPAVLDDATEHSTPLNDRIESSITIPVGEWGVFQALETESSAFDASDRQLLELLVTPLATTIERIQTEETLRDRTRALEQQNERLDQFASVVSHDLRNPLNVAQLSVANERTERESEHLTLAANALDRMEEMIADMLQLARVEACVTDVESVSLQSVAEQAWQTVQTSNATLDIRFPQDAVVEGEPALLRSIFENLFRNAVSHNDAQVVVRAGLLDNEEPSTGFYVEDDGVGIDPDERDVVFEYGYTINEEDSGLGLAIVRDFVEAHGWTIHITDGPDGGSRFEIRTREESPLPTQSRKEVDSQTVHGLNP